MSCSATRVGCTPKRATAYRRSRALFSVAAVATIYYHHCFVHSALAFGCRRYAFALSLLRRLHEGAPPEAPAEASVEPEAAAEPEALAEPDAPAEAPIPETPVAADDSDADDEGPWPRPGQVVEVVWTKGTTLENPGDDLIDGRHPSLAER